METTKHINAPEPTGWISISAATYLVNREWQINNLYGHGLHLSSPFNCIPRRFPKGIIDVKPIWIIWSNHRLHLLSQYLCDICSYSQTLDSGKKNKTENMGWPSKGIATKCGYQPSRFRIRQNGAWTCLMHQQLVIYDATTRLASTTFRTKSAHLTFSETWPGRGQNVGCLLCCVLKPTNILGGSDFRAV